MLEKLLHIQHSWLHKQPGKVRAASSGSSKHLINDIKLLFDLNLHKVQ